VYGSLGGIPFRIDPQSISWSYTPKTMEQNTIGGKVVQVFGSTMSQLVVQGYFGNEGPLKNGVRYNTNWEAQQAFLDQVDRWVQAQIGDFTGGVGVGVHNGKPIRFMYADPDGVEFDFMVYITKYQQPGSASSIRLAPDIYSPTWSFTLFIYQDNKGLSTMTSGNMVDHIHRIAGTFGWYPNDKLGVIQPGQFPKMKQVN